MSARIRDLATRPDGPLHTNEVPGGTFRISNAGQFGSLMATPIINRPQVGILRGGTIPKRPVVVAGPDGGDAIATRFMATLGLPRDHHAFDGVAASEFLAAPKRRPEMIASQPSDSLVQSLG